MVEESWFSKIKGIFSPEQEENKPLLIFLAVVVIMFISGGGYLYLSKTKPAKEIVPSSLPQPTKRASVEVVDNPIDLFIEKAELWVKEAVEENPSDKKTGVGLYPAGESDKLGVIGFVEKIDLQTSVLVVKAGERILNLYFEPDLEVSERPGNFTEVPMAEFEKMTVSELKVGDQVNAIVEQREGDYWVWGLMKI